MIRFEQILEKVESYKPDFDQELLERAYIFSAREHRGQVRSSGEPYLVHPLQVAYILAEMRLDETSIAVGLLHDVLEDTLTTKETLQQMFGDDVAEHLLQRLLRGERVLEDTLTTKETLQQMFGDVVAEHLLQRLLRGERVLEDVVEQPDGDGGLVEAHLREDVRDLEGVDQVRLARAADL